MISRGFGSDNHAAIHPTILASLQAANEGHAPSYGTDLVTEKAIELFRHHFGAEAQVYFVFNGTAANVLALQTVTSGYNSVLCSDVAHIHVDECAAPEFAAQVKLLPIASVDGKIPWALLPPTLIRRGDQHYSQIKAISLTQPTELGTTYSLNEIREITNWAHANQMYVHIDGARLANAVVSLNTGFRELCTNLKIDVVSFGGTKNGLMMGEAVIVLNSALGEHFKYRRKQLGQLPSKTRFISSQFNAYWTNDLWKSIASHSISMARALRSAVQEIPEVQVTIPTQSNAVFAKIPKPWVKPLREKYFFYIWNETTFECRWMTSWDTQEEDIIGFSQKMKELSR